MADREDRERNWRRREESSEHREGGRGEWGWAEDRGRDWGEGRDRDRNWGESRNRDREGRERAWYEDQDQGWRENRAWGEPRNRDFEGRERDWEEGRDRRWGQGMNRDRSSGYGYRGQYGFEGRGGRGGEFSGRGYGGGYGRGEFGDRGYEGGYGRGEFGGRGYEGGYGQGEFGGRRYGRGSQDRGRDWEHRDYDEDYGGQYGAGYGGEGRRDDREGRSWEGRRDRGYGGRWSQEHGRFGDRDQGGWEDRQRGAEWRYDDDFDMMDYDEDMDTYLTYTEYWYIPGPFSGVGPEAYQRSNERIEEDINERLTHHGQIDARNIEVKIDQGNVTLTGTVKNRQMKRMAEDVVESVWGVHNIQNELKVQDRQEEHQGRHEQQEEQQTETTASTRGGRQQRKNE
jgi:hypothetical protein